MSANGQDTSQLFTISPAGYDPTLSARPEMAVNYSAVFLDDRLLHRRALITFGRSVQVTIHDLNALSMTGAAEHPGTVSSLKRPEIFVGYFKPADLILDDHHVKWPSRSYNGNSRRIRYGP